MIRTSLFIAIIMQYLFIYAYIFANIQIKMYICQKQFIMSDWNDKVKRLLKSELVRRGISNSYLVVLLKEIGIEETKSSIDSKISRGTFSACFFLQCLTAIGCERIEIQNFRNQLSVAAEPQIEYNHQK